MMKGAAYIAGACSKHRGGLPGPFKAGVRDLPQPGRSKPVALALQQVCARFRPPGSQRKVTRYICSISSSANDIQFAAPVASALLFDAKTRGCKKESTHKLASRLQVSTLMSSMAQGLLQMAPLEGVSPLRNQGMDLCGGRRPTEYELSLGKIVDTLKNDYPAFFEREPNFDIYDDHLVFELGRPFHGVSALHGKQSYRRALLALQRLGRGALSDGTVACQVHDGTPYGHALKVAWQCNGSMLGKRCVHISAISLYSVNHQAEKETDVSLAHRVHKHSIEFLEIHPPSLRSLLLGQWWRPQSRLEPVLALRPGESCAQLLPSH